VRGIIIPRHLQNRSSVCGRLIEGAQPRDEPKAQGRYFSIAAVVENRLMTRDFEACTEFLEARAGYNL
jgi:hypothetical protein